MRMAVEWTWSFRSTSSISEMMNAILGNQKTLRVHNLETHLCVFTQQILDNESLKHPDTVRSNPWIQHNAAGAYDFQQVFHWGEHLARPCRAGR